MGQISTLTSASFPINMYSEESLAGRGLGCVATRDIEEGELIVSEEPALVLGATEKRRGVSIGDNVCCVSEQAYMKMQIIFMSGRI